MNCTHKFVAGPTFVFCENCGAVVTVEWGSLENVVYITTPKVK